MVVDVPDIFERLGRERMFLMLYSAREIARKTGLHRNTIQTYLKRLLGKEIKPVPGRGYQLTEEQLSRFLAALRPIARKAKWAYGALDA